MLTPGELAASLNKLIISPLMIGHQQVAPEWKRALGRIRYPSLWLIVKGKGKFTINGSVYPAEPGKLFFFTPDMMVSRTTDPEHTLEYYFLRFQYAECYQDKEDWKFSLEPSFPLQGMYTIHNPPQLIYIWEQLVSLWKRRGQITAMRRKLLIQELMLTILLDLRSQKITGDTNAAIDKTQDYISWHYREPLTLELLAQMAGLSVSHYSRLFKKSTGYSPIDYLTHIRIDRAKELLVLSGYRLKSIADSVGYSDEFYFSRIFKKIEGVSPRDYAKKHRADDLNQSKAKNANSTPSE
nr:AraC family transcriptional regulator [Paenibacillus senegalensis]